MSINEQQLHIIQLLGKVKAIMYESHIVTADGLHRDGWIDPYVLYPSMDEISKLADILSEKFEKDNVDIVIGYNANGAIFAQWVAFQLSKTKSKSNQSTPKKVLAAFAEKNSSGEYFIGKSFESFIKGKNVLIVEDIITKTSPVKSMIELVRSIGGVVVGVGTICNQGNVSLFGIEKAPKLLSLVRLTVKSWQEWEDDKCPLCKENIPISIDFRIKRKTV